MVITSRNTLKNKGFTIVELLIVIVIIGILAAVTIVSYSGVQDQARVSAVRAGLLRTTDKLELYKHDNNRYPTTSNFASGLGISGSDGIVYEYTSSTGLSYCVTVTKKSTSYYIDSTTSPPTAINGLCPGHNGTDLPTSYTAFRFQAVGLRNPSTDAMQISEFQVLIGSTRQSGATAYGYNHSSPQYENPPDANDNVLGTKFLDFTKTVGYMYLVFPSPVAATGYRFATANDSPDRDPITWAVYGSNNTTGGSPGSWTLLDTKTNYSVTTSRMTYVPDFTLPQ